MTALENFFGVKERKSTIGTEIMAGLTTFMVSAYIIFVNPAILSFSGIPDLEGQGVPFGPALAATCLVTALLTLAYGLWAKYPFLIAPGMGLNAVVAFQLIAGRGLTWQQAMAVIFLEGLIILILVLTGFRQAMMTAIPTFLKKAISVGIGLFILLIGLVNGGLIQMTGTPSAPLALGSYDNIPVAITIIGLVVTIVLYLLKVKGSLLWGILISTVVAIILNALTGWTAFTTPGVAVIPTQIVSLPDFSTLGAPFMTVDGSLAIVGMFAKLGVLAAILTIFSLMLSDFFDTMGTIVGIGSEAGFLDKDGQYPKSDLTKILTVDSLGAMLGGLFGSSSATTYIESAAGVSEGGRTGLASVVTALLFAVMMFFSPIAGVIPAQATAPALILVGLFMCAVLGDIQWREPEEALPALMIITMMPFTYSITNGIGWGFVVYGLVKLVKGEAGKVHWLLWVIIAAFLLYFALPVLGF
jgi:AGZA family xanthine/uracil permease-like MFS transporter